MDDELARRREANDLVRHDLRNRLAIGQGFLALLRDHHDQLTQAQRDTAVAGVAEAFARVEAFTRRVLMDEKLQTREPRPDRVAVPVAALLGAARAAYPAVVVDVAPDAPEEAYADPPLVREVLDNLLANATAAAPAGTDVTLRVRRGGTGVRFEVHDAGDEVTEADRAVLFRRYGRTERSRRTQAPGLGLGLSIVRRLVEAHGGSYGVETGAGTTFWVELPVSPEGGPAP